MRKTVAFWAGPGGGGRKCELFFADIFGIVEWRLKGWIFSYQQVIHNAELLT
jgi:hypothetical protein